MKAVIRFYSINSGHFRLAVVLFLFVLGFNGCSNLEIQSVWDSNIIIDGNASDWENLKPVTNQSQLSADARNDSNYLYLLTQIELDNTNQPPPIMGLTLWIKPTSGEYDKIGLKLIQTSRKSSFPNPEFNRENHHEHPKFQLPSPNSEIEVVDDQNQFLNRIIPNVNTEFSWVLLNNQDNIILEMQLPRSDKKYGLWDFDSENEIEIGFKTGLDNEKLEPDRNDVINARGDNKGGPGRGIGMSDNAQRGKGGRTGDLGAMQTRTKWIQGTEVWMTIKLDR